MLVLALEFSRATPGTRAAHRRYCSVDGSVRDERPARRGCRRRRGSATSVVAPSKRKSESPATRCFGRGDGRAPCRELRRAPGAPSREWEAVRHGDGKDQRRRIASVQPR